MDLIELIAKLQENNIDMKDPESFITSLLKIEDRHFKLEVLKLLKMISRLFNYECIADLNFIDKKYIIDLDAECDLCQDVECCDCWRKAIVREIKLIEEDK